MKIVSKMSPELYCYFVKMAVLHLVTKAITAREDGLVGYVNLSDELDELSELLDDERLQQSYFSVHASYIKFKLENWKSADIMALYRILNLVVEVDFDVEREFVK